MALPSTGAISLLDVRNELGKTGAISLGDSAVRTLAGRTSGAISMSDLRGKSSYTHQLTIGTDSRPTAVYYGYGRDVNAFGGLNPDNINGIKITELYSEYYSYDGSYALHIYGYFGVDSVDININNISLQLENLLAGTKFYSLSSSSNPKYKSQLQNIFTYLKNNLGKTVGVVVKI